MLTNKEKFFRLYRFARLAPEVRALRAQRWTDRQLALVAEVVAALRQAALGYCFPNPTTALRDAQAVFDTIADEYRRRDERDDACARWSEYCFPAFVGDGVEVPRDELPAVLQYWLTGRK